MVALLKSQRQSYVTAYHNDMLTHVNKQDLSKCFVFSHLLIILHWFVIAVAGSELLLSTQVRFSTGYSHFAQNFPCWNLKPTTDRCRQYTLICSVQYLK